MSWDKTYTHTLALAFDRNAAAIVFNEPDITVSSLCWIVRNGSTQMVQALELYGWQDELLIVIGAGLEYFWPGHCASARAGDLQASARSRQLLGAS